MPTHRKKGRTMRRRRGGGKDGSKTVKSRSVKSARDSLDMRSLFDALPGDEIRVDNETKSVRKRTQTPKLIEYKKALARKESIAKTRKDNMDMSNMFGQMGL